MNDEKEIISDEKIKINSSKISRKTRRNIFYWLMLALPLLQIIFFYFYVNFNSLSLAFRVFDFNAEGRIVSHFSLDNFIGVWSILSTYVALIKNSAIASLCRIVFGLFLGTIFSYYIYKKYPLASMFKVLLFIPSVVAGVVLTLLFQYITTDAYVEITKNLTGETVLGLFDSDTTRFTAVLFYSVWCSFGSTVLLVSGSMSGINDAIVESASLDGVNVLQEFWLITLPMIFNTFVTFLIIQIAQFFTNTLNLYTFFQGSADPKIWTFGYKFLLDSKKENAYINMGGDLQSRALTFSEMSALGVVFTLVTFGAITLVKKLLSKFGPSVD